MTSSNDRKKNGLKISDQKKLKFKELHLISETGHFGSE
ncbi:hypothetical protein CAEBREN_18376 [Caenorhabditis brenneri]|uniref:Uncharacterized protein n=1 Tax=Caenorhabditis brenneri TaxID=135651 RepID=G0MI78_CAEBE|nr:hypothetical protein CAEBREN_18376 [Caenorhabditis brenneri]